MNFKISKDGRLYIEPLTDMEKYTLTKWYEDFQQGKSEICLSLPDNWNGINYKYIRKEAK